MTLARPQTIAAELDGEISELQEGLSRYADPADIRIRKLLHRSGKLRKVDAINGSLSEAMVWHLCGDIEQGRYWLANAARLSGAQTIAGAAAPFLVNLGFFSEADAHIDQLADTSSGNLTRSIELSVITCSFSRVLKVVEPARLAGIQLASDSIRVAEQGVALMERMDIDPKAVQAVLDIAGEVLRRHELFWLGPTPVLRMVNDDDAAGMLYQLRVAASPQEADRMTDEVLDLLIERSMDVPGLAFSFLPEVELGRIAG